MALKFQHNISLGNPEICFFSLCMTPHVLIFIFSINCSIISNFIKNRFHFNQPQICGKTSSPRPVRKACMLWQVFFHFKWDEEKYESDKSVSVPHNVILMYLCTFCHETLYASPAKLSSRFYTFQFVLSLWLWLW